MILYHPLVNGLVNFLLVFSHALIVALRLALVMMPWRRIVRAQWLPHEGRSVVDLHPAEELFFALLPLLH